MIKVIAMKLVKFLNANSLKLGYRYLISIICMFLFTYRIFSANDYSNWRRFWRMKSRIKPNCKPSYFISKTSSVNLRFSKSASLQQFFSHDAKTMQWWNVGFILCDRSSSVTKKHLKGRNSAVNKGSCDCVWSLINNHNKKVYFINNVKVISWRTKYI